MNSALELHSVIDGDGEPVVMLHGWGMHSGIWGEFADELAKNYQLIKIDLPGHGKSEMVCSLSLKETVQQLLQQLPPSAHFIGWSLGGTILMHLATVAPERVRSITLLAASPCFAQQIQWSSAMKSSVLKNFATALEQDYRKTLLQFIALQTLSSGQSTESLKQLRRQLFEHGEPDKQALRQGLDMLMHTDVRADFASTKQPCLVLLGARDQLVPVSISKFYQMANKNCQIEIISNAGHVPFISHATATLECVKGFLKDV